MQYTKSLAGTENALSVGKALCSFGAGQPTEARAMKRNFFIFSRLSLIILAAICLIPLLTASTEPNENEQSLQVPESLLELQKDLEEVDASIKEVWSEVSTEWRGEAGPRARRRGPLGVWEWLDEQEKKGGAHSGVQKLQRLQTKRAGIVAKAWQTYNRLSAKGEGSESSGSEVSENKELRKWMTSVFGPPRPRRRLGQEQNAFPPTQPPGERLGAQLQKGAKRIQELEKRVETLESIVERQRGEIEELKGRIEALEGARN